LEIHLLKVTATIGNLFGYSPSIFLISVGHILDLALYAAATIGKLCLHSIGVLQCLIAESTYSIVNAAEIVVQGVVECGKTVSEAVGLLIDFAYKSLLVNCGTNIRLCSTGSVATRATAKSATETAKTTVSAPTKQKQDYDPPPIVADAVADAVITVTHKSNLRYFDAVCRRSFHGIQPAGNCAETTASCIYIMA
jgi:hypothetical protein